ncbi:hypothetical protein QTP86_026085, partial [Hemibagrus guttatus]
PASVKGKSQQTFHDLSSDSGGEYGVHRERIPTLQPGQFDGSTSWREFLSRFEDCARANHWSERTMTVQMRFCLVGAAGAVIHKNPRSGRWDYARIVEEVEAAYGPSSEHAAAIGIELRQRVHKAGELLHVLRDDIYEKVSIVYTDHSKREQDSISVEVFTNVRGDAEIVQRLLEEPPRTLARPYEIAHSSDQTFRLCVDYRVLNERTIKDAYPLPRIQDTLDTLSTAKWFSTLALASGYWQVELTPGARQAAAFCSGKGLFEWNVMPFGLCNAPAMFQHLMDRVLAGMQWEICLVYLDDIIVLGKDVKEMLQRLAQVFERLRQANLKLKPTKCCLFRHQVAYLGHIVSERGITTDPQKVQKIQQWPQPPNVNEVRQFVGLASYYRRFVKDFATVAKTPSQPSQETCSIPLDSRVSVGL